MAFPAVLRFMLPKLKRRSVFMAIISSGLLVLFVATRSLRTPSAKRRHPIIDGMKSSATTVLSRQPTETAVGTGLNLHLWKACGFDVKSLRHWPHFPRFPDVRSSSSSLRIEVKDKDIGQRLFGFLLAPSTGRYRFAISSDDGSELWLSTNVDPKNVRLVAQVQDNASFAWTEPGNFNKYPSQVSTAAIQLEKGQKYFIECLHKNGAGIGHVNVLWQVPGARELSDIDGQLYLRPYCSNASNCTEQSTDQDIPSHFKGTEPSPVPREYFEYYFNTSFIDKQYLQGILPVLPYNPKYVITDRKVGTYQGIWIVFGLHSAVYPEDVVQIRAGSFHMSGVREFRPNELIPKETAENIVGQFIRSLEYQHQKRFSLEKLIGVERKTDKEKGDRYFLELKLYDKAERKSLRIAQYVFQDVQGHVWFPEGVTWNRSATIHFVVPVKNQAMWVVYMVEQICKLYLSTRDENFHLIIIDFESTDGNIEKMLKDSPLSRKYTLIRKTGKFHKTLAIQDAVATISDPDSIVFLFDLHITVPVTLLDSIRKHTIQHKMVFLPIVARLDCGYSPVDPKGRWEEIGSGLLSVYKSDWDRFHGMDVEKFKNKWGGEDWDLLDRILRIGLEPERLKIPGFYHYWHTKEQLWDKSLT